MIVRRPSPSPDVRRFCPTSSILRGSGRTILILLCSNGLSALSAQESESAPRAEASDTEPTVLDSIYDSLFRGDFVADLRLRAEIADTSDSDTSQAYNTSTRLGYGTKPLHGFSLYFDFEDIRSADDNLYNAAGLNGEPEKTVIADPEATELNQAFVKYANEYVTAIAGRQYIVLDDSRFIGDIIWRLNTQTYDAYTLSSQWIPDTSVLYSYVDDVNRIFGPDSGRDFQSDSHLLHATYTGCPYFTVSGFAYFLDFSNSDANSSNTFGLRGSGSYRLGDDLALGYRAGYAVQVDAADNPTDYTAHYYLLDASIELDQIGSVGAGYEVLGSDDGDFGFRTPLATAHKFNGWADLFLTTPADGLEDLYLYLGADLPLGVRGRVIYHFFFSEDRSSDFGGEFNALFTKKLTEHISLLGKAAIFHSDNDRFPNTVQRYWAQVQLTF